MTARLAEKFCALQSGPAFSDLACGPLISPEQKFRLEKYLEEAKADGLNFAAEGVIVADAPSGGNYVKPLLIRDVPPDHAVAQEELFGPVLAVMPFQDEEQAVELANGTPFGLVSGVWTQDGATAVSDGQKTQIRTSLYQQLWCWWWCRIAFRWSQTKWTRPRKRL